MLPRVLLASLVLLCGAVGRADDPTFREFPRQQAPRPDELARMLAELQLRSNITAEELDELQALARELGLRAPTTTDPESRESLRRMAEGLNGDRPMDPETRQALEDWLRGRRPTTTPRTTPEFLPRVGRDPALDRQPPRSRVASPTDRSVSPVPNPTGRPPASHNATPSWDVARNALQINPPRQDAPPPTTQREFGERMNALLMEAAQRAASRRGADGTSSAGSFLDPLMARIQEYAADRAGDWRRQMARSRGSRGRSRSTGFSRFIWDPSVMDGAVPGTAMIGAVATPWLLLVPLSLGMVMVGLALWRRKRSPAEDDVAPWQRGVTPPRPRIASRRDVVTWVDRFLAWRFGRSSQWWHCGAVERALNELRPDLRLDAKRLANLYEVCRYGPDEADVSRQDLAQAAETLQRLIDAVRTAPPAVPRVAA